jgi:hypothetical protein
MVPNVILKLVPGWRSRIRRLMRGTGKVSGVVMLAEVKRREEEADIPADVALQTVLDDMESINRQRREKHGTT